MKVDDLNHSDRIQNDSQMTVAQNSKCQLVAKGSVIFPKRGAAIMTNKARIMGKFGYMDTNMMALEPVKVESDFLYLFICRTGLYKIADTSTIPQINNKHIEPYEICMPTVDEQQQIGTFSATSTTLSPFISVRTNNRTAISPPSGYGSPIF